MAHRRLPTAARQRGQALIYGLFVLLGGLAALYFVFNTGQMTAEKTKLVNTADAVAYSAATLHARALNFDAYSNRALIANEVLIAQAVSVASWSAQVRTHTERINPMNCRSQYSVPVGLMLVEYVPVCYLLTLPATRSAAANVDRVVQSAAQGAIAASEVAKLALQGAQTGLTLAMRDAPLTLMRQVAQANYAGDGAVTVDPVMLTDGYADYHGAPFVRRYAGAQRGRMRDTVVRAIRDDAFIGERSWTSDNALPCVTGLKAAFRRRGGTEMVGLDAWQAVDTAALHTWQYKLRWNGPRCDHTELPLGLAARSAGNKGYGASHGRSLPDNPDSSNQAGKRSWRYAGLPAFADINPTARAAADPRVRLAVRLTRRAHDTRTSGGSAAARPTGRLGLWQHEDGAFLAATSAAEVYFDRPARADGAAELASLFNPFWQAHLVAPSAAEHAAALARGAP